MTTFNRRSQLYKHLRNIASTLDECYNTTYHTYDINIDIADFNKWYETMLTTTKANNRYNVEMSVGFRKYGVSRNCEEWGDSILFIIVFGYDVNIGQFYLTTISK